MVSEATRNSLGDCKFLTFLGGGGGGGEGGRSDEHAPGTPSLGTLLHARSSPLYENYHAVLFLAGSSLCPSTTTSKAMIMLLPLCTLLFIVPLKVYPLVS